MNYFIGRKKCFAESINLKICDIIIDIAVHYNLWFCFFKNLMYESEIRSDISGTYEKHFQFVNSWDYWKLIPGPFMILIKWQC